VTGTETVVFSCFNQDQEMDRVDFRTLRRRFSQNGVQEKLTKPWVDRCLQHLGERPAIAAELKRRPRRSALFDYLIGHGEEVARHG
jgi:hypothetical protein